MSEKRARRMVNNAGWRLSGKGKKSSVAKAIQARVDEVQELNEEFCFYSVIGIHWKF